MIKVALLLCLISYSLAAKEVYQVLLVKGEVVIYTLNAKQEFVESQIQNKKRYETPFRILTKENSLVVIKSSTKTNKIDQNSKVDFMGIGDEAEVIVNQGSFLSSFKNQESKPLGLKVKSRAASLGVRGTMFMFYIDANSDKHFMTVNKGSVEYQAKNSNSSVLVEENSSAMANESLKNLKPSNYEFQKHINWNLDHTAANISQPKELYSSFEKIWSQYKKEQEFIWENRSKDMQNKWNKMSKDNKRRN